MKKQSGFTLIELMVVMAIIAILATAGLSAYTGYLKKARDTTRIADLRAINSIVQGMMSSTGLPPQTAKEVYDAVKAANNSIALVDSQSRSFISSGDYIQNGTTNIKKLCYMGTTASRECNYTYRVCDAGLGFAIGARFESQANSTTLYTADDPDDTVSGSTPETTFTNFADADIYEVGSCQKRCSASACPTTNASILPTVIENVAAASAHQL